MLHAFFAKWGFTILVVMLLLPIVVWLADRRYGERRPWPVALRLLAILEAAVLLGVGGVVGGVWMIDYGIQAGRHYATVDPGRPLALEITELSIHEGSLLASYSAAGVVRELDETTTIPIRRYTYERRRPGDTLVVYATELDDPRFVWNKRYDEAMPLLNVFGFRFSWRLLLGVFLGSVGTVVFTAIVHYQLVGLRHDLRRVPMEDRVILVQQDDDWDDDETQPSDVNAQ